MGTAPEDDSANVAQSALQPALNAGLEFAFSLLSTPAMEGLLSWCDRKTL